MSDSKLTSAYFLKKKLKIGSAVLEKLAIFVVTSSRLEKIFYLKRKPTFRENGRGASGNTVHFRREFYLIGET